jgi:hypothetical protein
MLLASEKSKEEARRPGVHKGKYLVTWSLTLGRAEIERISARPKVLDKGLNYVKSIAKEGGIEVYRIVSLEETTHFARPVHGSFPAARLHGIALVEASSIEEARKMVDGWVDGFAFGFGEVPVRSYLDYDVQPLMELAKSGTVGGGRQ